MRRIEQVQATKNAQLSGKSLFLKVAAILSVFNFLDVFGKQEINFSWWLLILCDR